MLYGMAEGCEAVVGMGFRRVYVPVGEVILGMA
jgi:hypothetical protein